MVGPAIINLLLTDTATAAIVGTQIGPKKMQQGTQAPYVIVKQTGGSHVLAFQGLVGAANPTFSITAWHLDTARADALLDVVRARLFPFRGSVAYTDGNGNPATLKIKGIFVDDESEDWDPPVHTDEAGLHSASLSIRVWHDE